MGLKDLFKKQETEATAQDKPTFKLGVEDVYKISDDSLDLVVTGNLEGTLKVGDFVWLTNLGDDNGTVTTSAIYAMENAQREKVFEVTDEPVALWLEDAMPLGIKKGTVLHEEGANKEEIYKTFVNTLGNVFVGRQEGVLTQRDIETLTLADLSEIARVFLLYCHMNASQESPEEHTANVGKIEQLMVAVRDKLLQADELVTVYSKKTKEPYLFSQTQQREEGGFICSSPMIFIAPVAYEERLASRFADTEIFELRRIQKGEDGKGIENFFLETFYQNGATGVHLVTEQTSLAAEGIIAAPDYTGVAEEDIPVTNPDVMRWILLLGQLGFPQTEEQKIMHGLYYRFLCLELPKAKFLTPIKLENADTNAQIDLQSGEKLNVAILPGKDEKEAMVFYTDWKRLRQIYDESWSGMIQTLSQVTKAFDVVINPSENPALGCYVNDAMFEEMKKVD